MPRGVLWARGSRCTSPEELVRAGSSLVETCSRTRSALQGQKKTLWRQRPPAGSVAIPLLRFTVGAMDRLPVWFDHFNIKSSFYRHKMWSAKTQILYYIEPRCSFFSHLPCELMKYFMSGRFSLCWFSGWPHAGLPACPVLCRQPLAFSDFMMWLDWLICCLLSCPYF